MTIVTKAPNTITQVGGAVIVGDTLSIGIGVLSDGLDSSYYDVQNNATHFIFSFGAFSIPATAQIQAVQITVRYSYPNYTGGVGGSNEMGPTFVATGNATPLDTVTQPDNFIVSRTFIVAGITDPSVLNTLKFAAKSYAPYKFSLIEANLTVTYNNQPTVVLTKPINASTIGNNAPKVAWTFTDPEGYLQLKYRVKLFTAAQYGIGGFDPEVSPFTQDSGEITSTSTYRTLTTVLANGVYRAYVKAADVYGYYSPWANTQFTVTSAVPPTPVFNFVVPDDPTQSVALTVTGNTTAWASYTNVFDVQRSVDAGVTWLPVRYCNGVNSINFVTNGAGQVITDSEAPSNVGLRYRVRIVSFIDATEPFYSAWSTIALTILNSTDWWLKNTTYPGYNSILGVLDKHTITLKGQQTTYYTLGNKFPIVVSDLTNGEDGTLTYDMQTLTEYNAIRRLLVSTNILLLQSPFNGDQWYIRVNADRSYTTENTSPEAPYRTGSIPYVEVASGI